MAKATRIRVKMVGSKGHFYVTDKNPRTSTEKLKMKKYNPRTRKHEEYKEEKMDSGKKK